MSLRPLDLPDADSAHDWVQTRAKEGLATARELVQRLRDTPPTDALDALRQWDEVSLQLSNVAAMGSLLSNVHPLEDVRDAAETAEQDVQKLVTELSLDRGLYDVFAALDAEQSGGLDDEAARLLTKVLDDFRRSGVDRDDETRARITAINERITELDQDFGKVVRNDVRTVRVTPERLDGLPADWLEAHPADDDGLVTVTTDYPDVVPVRMFAHDADVRRELTMAFLNRGWPASHALLKEMFALRHELATLVGYDDWASYDADVKMIGTGPAIPEFIDRIA
ncbi:MAG: Thimet oligopeptidase, partial [Nocardioides sp.]|nr:Thimet oligopeptidase [Nocardioides sp.]